MRKPYLMSSLAMGALMLTVAAPLLSAAEPYPKAIAQAVKSGVTVVKSFPAASGLTGWVMSQDGRTSIVFTTADKKTLLAGALVDENGENLSAKYEDKYVPKPDLSALFLNLEKSAHVVEGTLKDPKSVMYVFVDANCPYCHFTWIALQPYEKVGLQVRWILVDTLGPTSLPKAIEVMSAADKGAAFKKMELNHGKAWTAPAQASAAAQPAAAAGIRSNNALMAQFGIGGTPGVIWKDKQGKVQLKAGMPRLSELAAMTGLPEQKMEDAALEKFR